MSEIESDIALSVEGVTLNFSGNRALDDVSFELRRGDLLGIIGPNGAGKTSMLNCINAIVRPQAGRILYGGVDLLTRKPHEIIRLGIARTFQGVSLQPNATVADNILFGRDFKMRYGLLAATVYVGRAQLEEARHREKVEEVLEFLEIQRFRNARAGDLPWAQQKLVEIGRALAAEPDLLLLDEPTSGMTREEKEDVASYIARMRAELGISQILIEHDAPFVGDLSDRMVALDYGKVIAAGTPDDVLSDPHVATAYLGVPPEEIGAAPRAMS